MDINYFELLRMYPEMVIMDNLEGVDVIDYINYMESLNRLIKIDVDKLYKIIYVGKTSKDNNIFKNELKIKMNSELIYNIIFTGGDTRFYFHKNEYEKKGKFNLYCNNPNSDKKFSNKEELKNIKRSLLIDRCLK